MIQYKTSAQLKADARGQLLGKYSIFVPAVLITQTITTVISDIIRFVSDRTSVAGMILYLLLTMIVLLLTSVFSIGLGRMSLQTCCNRGVTISDMFYGFYNQLDKSLHVILRLFGLVALPMVISCIPMLLLAFFTSVWGVIIGAIFLVAGFIVGLYISFRYALVYYILLDFPQYSVSQIFQMSAYLMKGHIASYLYIMVSFIPLHLLSLLSFGLAELWIAPYVQVTSANFYCNLVKVAASRQVANET